MPDPVLLSVSRCNTYQNCPRNFRYKYINKYPEKEYIEALYGSFFHKVLDLWANLYIKTSKINWSMKEAYHLALDTKDQYDEKIFRDRVNEVAENIVKEWIRGYTELLRKDPPRILAHEKGFNFLLEGKFLVRGFIDRIDELADGTIRILDYKTGKSRYCNDKQILTYAKALIAEPFYRDKKIIGTYVFVNEGYKEVTYECTTQKIDETVEHLVDTGNQIISDTTWSAKFSGLCGWCSHKFICQKECNQESWK